MGKTQGYNPLSKWSGRVGGEVYKVVNGEQVVTPYEKHVQTTKSVGQMAANVKMALAGKLSAITPAEVLMGLRGSKTDRRNALVSNIIKATDLSVSGDNFIATLQARDLILSEGKAGICNAAIGLTGSAVMGTITPVSDNIDQVMVIAYAMDYNGDYTKCVYQVVNAEQGVAANINIQIGFAPAIVHIYYVPIFFTAAGRHYYSEHQFAYLPQSQNGAYVFSAMLKAGAENLEYGNSQFVAQYGSGVTYRTLTLGVTPNGGGITSGAGTYADGTSVIISAMANSGYVFNRWSDGETANPRTLVLTENRSINAEFSVAEGTVYGLTFMDRPGSTFESTDVLYGGGAVVYTVNGGAEQRLTDDNHFVAPAGSTINILRVECPTGQAWDGKLYTALNGGNTITAPYSFVLNENTTFFVYTYAEANNYTLALNVSPSQGGSVQGAGSYAAGTDVIITAVPNSGYQFTGWSDGNTSVQRTITLNSNVTLTAQFQQISGAEATITLNKTAGADVALFYGVFDTQAEADAAGQIDMNDYSTPFTAPAGKYVGVYVMNSETYQFSQWRQTNGSGQVLSNAAKYVFAVSDSTTLFASCVNIYDEG